MEHLDWEGSEDCALETRNEIFAHLPARPSLDALTQTFHVWLPPLTPLRGDSQWEEAEADGRQQTAEGSER